MENNTFNRKGAENVEIFFMDFSAFSVPLRLSFSVRSSK
jgi:hypothetical protein